MQRSISQHSFNWLAWWIVIATDLTLLVGWVLLAAGLSGDNDHATWSVLWLFPLTIAFVTLASGMFVGWRGAAYASLVAVTIAGMAYQVHTGFRLAYLEGDIPHDTLIYNTTSPDIHRLAGDLQQLSLLVEGDNSLFIQIEACNSLDWPFHWYLREMTGVSYVRTIPDDTATRAPIIVGSLPEWSGGECAMPPPLPGYTVQQMVLRWHEPEWAVYRNFAIAPELDPGRSARKAESQPHGMTAIIGSVLDSFGWATSPAGQEKLFDLLMYRQTAAPMASFYVNVYIRNDLLPVYNGIRHGD